MASALDPPRVRMIRELKLADAKDEKTVYILMGTMEHDREPTHIEVRHCSGMLGLESGLWAMLRPRVKEAAYVKKQVFPTILATREIAIKARPDGLGNAVFCAWTTRDALDGRYMVVLSLHGMNTAIFKDRADADAAYKRLCAEAEQDIFGPYLVMLYDIEERKRLACMFDGCVI